MNRRRLLLLILLAANLGLALANHGLSRWACVCSALGCLFALLDGKPTTGGDPR
jgi:hypothetical protein